MIVIVGDTTLKAELPPDATASSTLGSNLSGKWSCRIESHAGLYGLGELEVLTRRATVPKVMTFQAIYRREVFSHASE